MIKYELKRLEALADDTKDSVKKNVNFRNLSAKYVRVTVEAEFNSNESASITKLVEWEDYDY